MGERDDGGRESNRGIAERREGMRKGEKLRNPLQLKHTFQIRASLKTAPLSHKIISFHRYSMDKEDLSAKIAYGKLGPGSMNCGLAQTNPKPACSVWVSMSDDLCQDD